MTEEEQLRAYRKEVARRAMQMKADLARKAQELRGSEDVVKLMARSGVDRKKIRNIETGKTDYRISTLLKLLAALSSNAVDTLITNEAEREMTSKLLNVMRWGSSKDSLILQLMINESAARVEMSRTINSAVPKKTAS